MPKEIQWSKRTNSRERKTPAFPQLTPGTLPRLWAHILRPREEKDPSLHSHSFCFSAKTVLGLCSGGWLFFRESCLEEIRRSCILYSVLALSGDVTRTHYLIRTALRMSPNVLHGGKKTHLKLTNTLMPPQSFCPTESIVAYFISEFCQYLQTFRMREREKDIIVEWVDKGLTPFSFVGVWTFPHSV